MRPTSQPRDDHALTCPTWCRRAHHPGDSTEDLLHQSDPAHVAVVHGDPRFEPDEAPLADAVVLRLVQRNGSASVWLEASSEESGSLGLLVSAESAGRLAGAMVALLEVL